MAMNEYGYCTVHYFDGVSDHVAIACGIIHCALRSTCPELGTW
jgi:hypothetical protein